MFICFKLQINQEAGEELKKETITLQKYAWEVNLGCK